MTSDSITHAQVDPYLRVRSEKVTQLLDMVGELGLAALGVTHHPQIASLELEGFEMAAHRLELLIHEAQDLVSSLRLVPVGNSFHRMDRLVRDLALQTGKKLEINIEGEDVEIDKAIVDVISDPLMHLIRNSADHGIENVEERLAAGKPANGKITLSAAQRGREVLITVADDGRGLNRTAILNKARQQGLIAPNAQPRDQEVWSCIFKSGFSTTQEVTKLSGRGVGMDVVQSTIRSLHGHIDIQTQHGAGTCITMVIPLSLAFLESLIVRSKTCLYAIPIDSVNEVFQPDEQSIVRSSASGESIIYRQGNPVPLISLEECGAQFALTNIVVVAQLANGSIGLMMDEVLGQQQVVMKPLIGHLKNIKGGVGCALLSSGEVAIALDIESLAGSINHEHSALPGKGNDQPVFDR